MPFGPNELVELDTDLSRLRKIPGAAGYYINQEGEVFTVRKLRPFTDEDGYLRVSTKRLRKAVHWLLARVFLPPPLSGQNEVRHLDGKPSNIALSNLAWGTRAENAADMARHGTVKGSRNPRAILTEIKVVEILNLANDNTPQSIAEMVGVSETSVKAVLSGQNWSHFTGIKRDN
jgi:hypothetical protein